MSGALVTCRRLNLPICSNFSHPVGYIQHFSLILENDTEFTYKPLYIKQLYWSKIFVLAWLLQNGLTPLHLTARENRIDVAKLLLKHNAPINAQTVVCNDYVLMQGIKTLFLSFVLKRENQDLIIISVQGTLSRHKKIYVYFSRIRANLRFYSHVYRVSSKHTYRPMRARVVSQLFYK